MKSLQLTLLLVCPFILFAQVDPTQEEIHKLGKSTCATPSISYDDWSSQFKYAKDQTDKNSGFDQLPLRAHIVRLDNGTGGLTLTDLNEALANLNYVYHDESIEWYLADINYIDNTNWYNFHQNEEAAMCGAHVVDDAVNVFFVNEIALNGGGFACGYAYYPFNSDTSLRILMDNGCTNNYINGTFAHEFGHHLNLPHTHNGTSNGNGHPNAEHVPRSGSQSNCTTDGDYICDTEADPTGSTSACVYTGGGTDIFGNAYVPDTDNIMSYYPDNCGGLFTAGQYTEIANGLTIRHGHSAYDIDGASPDVVTDPSNLTLVNNTFSITLNWTDNSNNEDGFLIERSEDGGTTFKPLAFGGTPPNVSTFVDNDIQPNTTYDYRLKASNDNPDHYSNVESITSDNCQTADLLFSGSQLIQSPVTVTGLPTTIPSCMSDVPVSIRVVGDFGEAFEICDILGEDQSSILDQTSQSSSDCNLDGGTSSFNLTASQYNSWAGNGAITFYIDANAQVGNFCSVDEVTACVTIESCGGGPPPSCPDDYAGPNMLTGTQDISEDFETDGMIESDQSIATGIDIKYDSGTTINLLPGFQVALGTVFESMIDGCGGLFKSEEESDSSK